MDIRIAPHPAKTANGTQAHDGLWCIYLDETQCGHFWKKPGDDFAYLYKAYSAAVMEAVDTALITATGQARAVRCAPGLVKVTGSVMPIIEDDDEEWGNEDGW